MKEHHFIVKYSKENGWSWDTDTEQNVFEDGMCVFNLETIEWETGYLGDGKFNDNDDEIGGRLNQILKEANNDNYTR